MKKIFGYSLLVLMLLSVGLFWIRRHDTPAPGEQVASGETHSEKDPLKRDQHKPAKAPETVSSESSSSILKSAKADINSHGQFSLGDIPSGKLHEQLARLNPTALKRALRKLSDPRIPRQDFNSLRVVSDGNIFYACDIPPGLTGSTNYPISAAPIATGSATADTKEISAASSATPPVRHSRPGSANIIYLDFGGATIAGTVWNTDYNGGAAFTTQPYSTDGDYGTFSDAEQAVIVRVWERVAEDFRPFDVDVTTEAPASTGANVVHVVITRSTRADNGTNPEAGDAGGVAFLDNFGSGYAAPYATAFVYHDHTSEENGMAVAISHEVGHYIGGLHHDGTNSIEYYSGHGSGDTSWGPIMGGPYGKNVTQWSKGEYYNANNTAEDDLALLGAKLGYVADDYGDSNGTAGALNINGNTFSASGVIGTTNDADRFSFTVGGGDLTLNASPFRSATAPNGGNLDILIQLLDSSGNVIASADPATETGAGIVTTVSAGTYYVRVSPVGNGAPMNNPPSGYTTYGSVGAYSITGSLNGVSGDIPSITSQPAAQTILTGRSTTFNVSAVGTPPLAYQWQVYSTGLGGWANISDSNLYAGTSSATLTILGANNVYLANSILDGNSYRCAVSNGAGSAYSNAALLTVITPPIDFAAVIQ